jgi:hypothetical protein
MKCLNAWLKLLELNEISGLRLRTRLSLDLEKKGLRSRLGSDLKKKRLANFNQNCKFGISETVRLKKKRKAMKIH